MCRDFVSQQPPQVASKTTASGDDGGASWHLHCLLAFTYSVVFVLCYQTNGQTLFYLPNFTQAYEDYTHARRRIPPKISLCKTGLLETPNQGGVCGAPPGRGVPRRSRLPVTPPRGLPFAPVPLAPILSLPSTWVTMERGDASLLCASPGSSCTMYQPHPNT